MSKVIIVGDTFVTVDTMKRAVESMLLPKPLEVVALEWCPEDSPEMFQRNLKLIEQHGPEAVPPPEGIMEELVDADYLFVHLAPISRRLLENAKQLKLVGTCRGGVEHIDMEAVHEKRIPVIHVIRNAEPVADYTLGLIYTVTRNIALSHEAVMKGEWSKKFPNDGYRTTLSNQTVGLVGLGHIGKMVAQRLVGLGVDVIAYDPFVEQEKVLDSGLSLTFVSLEELFTKADIVSLHMRVTPETENLVDESLLALMKPSAYLINTARPGILVKEAFIKVLKERKIAGAAIDVVWEEPMALDDPLRELDNIVITSHIAGDTVDAIPNSPFLLAKTVNDYIKTGVSEFII
ncbi:2-hydroxyacid dehydrogenase [Enterococcus raffinosus]|uniref:2-hydroxyacid dehydrogenase n=1 Tax=Enterococcus raffinosus TaxID=71452 RepID=UPI001C44FA03|nr:2-hydroxyacid dehydrogenase [Enterococcus raffinosus]MDT2572408.1 2-hydroxyacid dehydrogenase [Enterococcus raffinosus]QXJ59536.1 2-hydroxyacid dehydrogenase [Enterococcus raffinosus]